MRVLATHFIRQFPLHFPSRASPCAIRFRSALAANSPPPKIRSVRIYVLSSSEPAVRIFQLFFVVESERWSFNCSFRTRPGGETACGPLLLIRDDKAHCLAYVLSNGDKAIAWAFVTYIRRFLMRGGHEESCL